METNQTKIRGYSVLDDMDLRNGVEPWPETVKRQIAELQATATAQTAEINRLLDRVDHLERMLHRYLNTAEGDGR